MSRIREWQITEAAKGWALILAALASASGAMICDFYARVSYFDVGGRAGGAVAALLWGLAALYALTALGALAARAGWWRPAGSPAWALAHSLCAFSAAIPLTLIFELSPPLAGLAGLVLGFAALTLGLVWIGWAREEGPRPSESPAAE